MRLQPRRAKAAPWGRLACSRGSRRRGRAGGGRGGAATSRADRGAPPRGGRPPPVQRVRRLVKIMPGGGLGAVDARPPFDHVEIDFHDPPLAPGKLDQRREPGFEPFAQPVAARPQEDIFRGLHRDGAGAEQAAMSALVAIPGCFDRAPVKAVVAAEPGVLARHRGADQVRGDIIEPPPALVDAVTFDATDQHQGRPRRRQRAIKRDQHDRADEKADDAVERDPADPPQQAGLGTRGASRCKPRTSGRRGAMPRWWLVKTRMCGRPPPWGPDTRQERQPGGGVAIRPLLA